ncbi:MAG: GNAT family N-acetyltransferase [Clostridia bacterium]|nr:GNAT family N-acetyltransferase [Clostridia bacterium]
MNIRKATNDDISAIIDLLSLRIRWMDDKGLYQWNKTDYLNVYPYEYFLYRVEQDDLYVAVDQDAVVGVMALLRVDPRWLTPAKALYVHHLATHPNYRGLGITMLRFAEQEVLENGGDRLRLDCQTVNEALNQYYFRLGYRYVGQCIDGAYEGNLMEKILIPEERG